MYRFTRSLSILVSSLSCLTLALGCGSAAPDEPTTPLASDASRFASVAGATESPCLSQVNADGFGDSTNRWAWAMKSWGDHLYVGTLNTPSQSGDSETDLVLSGAPRTPGAGAQIWRYDGKGWKQMARDGFGNRSNEGIHAFTVFDDALYATTLNRAQGSELWRSTDGVSWKAVMHGGFGDAANVSIRGMAKWRQKLWLGTINPRGAQLWVYDGRTATPVGGFLRDERNYAISDIRVFGDKLFVSTMNSHGAQMFRFDGTRWVDVVGGAAATAAGFGDRGNTWISATAALGDGLYASTLNFDHGFAVWRTRDQGATWQPMIPNGLGNPNEALGWQLFTHEDSLYLGTASSTNAHLYRSTDGRKWVEEVGGQGTIAPSGMGDGGNFGLRAMASYFGELYVGTARCLSCTTGSSGFTSSGTEVWRRDSESCG